MGLSSRHSRLPALLKRGLRPDLLISLPGRTILTDVAVCHPLAPGAVKRRGGKLAHARKVEQRKKRKYAKLASQRRYEMLPFAAETSGGFAPAAVQLMHAMALAAAQTFQLWTHADEDDAVTECGRELVRKRK